METIHITEEILKQSTWYCYSCNVENKDGLKRLNLFKANDFKTCIHNLKFYKGFLEYVEPYYNEYKEKLKTTVNINEYLDEFKSSRSVKEKFIREILLPKNEAKCPWCDDGNVKVTWAYGFQVILDPFMKKEDTQRIANKCGWYIIHTQDKKSWLVRIGSIEDFSWSLAHCQLVLQSFLTQEQINNITKDGWKNVSLNEKLRLSKYLKEQIKTPEEYRKEYEEKIKQYKP